MKVFLFSFENVKNNTEGKKISKLRLVGVVVDFNLCLGIISWWKSTDPIIMKRRTYLLSKEGVKLLILTKWVLKSNNNDISIIPIESTEVINL